MMRSSAAVLLCAGGLFARETDGSFSLELVAETATVMLDGDVCARIQTPRSVRFATLKDPRDPWRAGDNYDVDAAAFNQTKKTLIRLSHLCAEACDVNLWMPVPGRTGRVQLMIRNVHEWSQFWTWGDLDQDTPEEMKQVLATGKRLAVSRKENVTSVLTPVYDSLGAIVAVAEAVSVRNADPRENVK